MQLSLMEIGVGDEELPALVAVPTAVAEQLHLALGGPGKPSETKARLWAAGAGSMFVGGGYMSFALSTIDPVLGPAGAYTGGMCVISFLGFATSTYLRWRALCSPDVQSDDTCEPSHYQMRDLLKEELTPTTASTLTALIRLFRSGFVALWLFVLVMVGALVAIWVIQDRLDVAVVMSWDVLMSYLFAKSLIAPVLQNQIASVIVIDRVQRVTGRVRRSTPATADFDGLLRDVVEAQHVVSGVAAELQWPTIIFIVALTSVASGVIFIGLGPQPTDPELTWVAFRMHDLMLVLGSTYLFCSILLLVFPAKITSACDDLGDAINGLTETRDESEAMLCMPNKEQRLQIEHLYGYVRKLNRGKGMGFMVARKRITLSFVISLMARVISVMIFVFPLIIGLSRVEREEAELLNCSHNLEV